MWWFVALFRRNISSSSLRVWNDLSPSNAASHSWRLKFHRFHHKNKMVTKWHVYTCCIQEHCLRVTSILHESCLYILIFPCMLCPRQLFHLLTLGSDCKHIQKVVHWVLHTKERTVIYYLKSFRLKHLLWPCMFWSSDHPQGAQIVLCWSYALKIMSNPLCLSVMWQHL
jgi:hypothetical protein